MTISYRTPGAWGAGLSRDLHPAEVDTNFYELKGLIDSIQADMPGTTVSILSMSQVGNDLYVNLTDGSVLGPFTLPVMTMSFRDEWLPATAYYVADVVTNNGSVYMVQAAHTSAATFDPGANDGLGQNYYGLLLANPANALPEGGGIGQVLTKASIDDYDVAWSSATSIPVGGAIDAVLTKLSSTDYDVGWDVPAVVIGIPAGGAVNATLTKLSSTNYDIDWIVRGKTISITGVAHPLVLTDTYGWLRCTNASGCALTIPTNATVAFALDTEITIRSATGGAVSIAADPGVTLNIPVGFTGVLLANGATALVKKVAADTWDLAGLLTPS